MHEEKRELKKQYTADEWLVRREEVFKKLPEYAHVEILYKEEKLYDRLLSYVLNSPGLYALQEYENVLKKEYPEQILDKYKNEGWNKACGEYSWRVEDKIQKSSGYDG